MHKFSNTLVKYISYFIFLHIALIIILSILCILGLHVFLRSRRVKLRRFQGQKKKAHTVDRLNRADCHTDRCGSYICAPSFIQQRTVQTE